jgi:hypothetical protein
MASKPWRRKGGYFMEGSYKKGQEAVWLPDPTLQGLPPVYKPHQIGRRGSPSCPGWCPSAQCRLQLYLIKALAKEFVQEEAQHVAEPKRWIVLHSSGAKLPMQK